MKNIVQRWQNGIPTINGWLSLNNAFATEVMARVGFDSITIDMQHGVSDYSTLLLMLQAINLTNTPAFVRIPWLDAGMIMKTLDAGANGIICPMINTKEDAINLVKYTRYPPLGERSFGPIRAKFLYDDYFKTSNTEIKVFAMIETKEAISNLKDILSVSGIDGIYIGPADLSSSLGVAPKFDQEEPIVIESIEYILNKAKEYNKFRGIHNLTPGYAKKMALLGFNFLTIGSDLFFMLDGAQKTIKEFRN